MGETPATGGRPGGDSVSPVTAAPHLPVVTPAPPPTAQPTETEPEHLLGVGQCALSYFPLQLLMGIIIPMLQKGESERFSNLLKFWALQLCPHYSLYLLLNSPKTDMSGSQPQFAT